LRHCVFRDEARWGRWDHKWNLSLRLSLEDSLRRLAQYLDPEIREIAIRIATQRGLALDAAYKGDFLAR
jgi:hypothetical protein